MNQQVKAGLNAVRDFLAGRSGEAKPDDTDDKATREVVGAVLLAAMSGRYVAEASRENSSETSGSDTREIPRFDANGTVPEIRTEENHRQQVPESAVGIAPMEKEQSENSKQEQERARKLFRDHGYFDEATQDLRAAKSPAERAAAARALGLFGSQRGTPYLIAAMFDGDPEVRSAAEEALAQISDPTVSAAVELNIEGEAASEPKSSVAAMAREAGRIKPNPQAYEESTAQSHSEMDAFESPVTSTTSGEIENSFPQAGNATFTASAISFTAADEENQLLQEEQTIRNTVEQVAGQLLETIAAIKESENEVQWRLEREGQLRVAAAECRRQEEELRKRADEEAEARRIQEREAVAAEQAARVKAEADAQRFTEEQTTLRIKVARLRLAAEEIARRRAEMETARQNAAEAAHEAEAARARDEAKSRHEGALKRLRSEAEALHLATNEVALEQANLKASRERAAGEIARLKEEQAAVEAAQRAEEDSLRREAEERNSQAEEQLRLQLELLSHADEEVAARRAEVEAARAKAETERMRLEDEINQQVETQRRLLETTRRRVEEEQERVQEETRRHAEAEQHRLAELEVVKAKAELESRQRADKEQQIHSQIDSLRIADLETRRRIEDAEKRRRAAEDAYRLVAEKVQRVEAEAHARVKEEERILAKLEAERRTVEIEAQSRIEQEKRIKEKIELFRRLEEQERPRIEEATLQLAAAEVRLQERKDRLREEEEARVLVENELNVVSDQDSSTQPGDRNSLPEGTTAQQMPSPMEKTARAFARSLPIDEGHSTARNDDFATSAVSPAIASYLNSVDPYKRAAAVAELARAGGPDAFNQIVECFDDHSPHVRNAAARALRKLEPNKTVDLLNRALEVASVERRRNIGAAIAASGLATEAIDNLVSENREDTYNALSILFVMAKTGEVYPLVQAIEGHGNVQVRMAAIKLLTLTGQADIANAAAKRRLEGHRPEIDHRS